MKLKPINKRELLIRFLIGGTAVLLCYLISIYSPIKFIGGVFAAFPAVMSAAIVMTALQEGNREAAMVAQGAVSGMVGCTACVLSALYLIKLFNSWMLGLAGAVVIWLFVAAMSNVMISKKAMQNVPSD